MSEQEGETVLLDKLAGSLLDYVEAELDGALRLREDLLDKRLMMTARLQDKMVNNLADGQEHRAGSAVRAVDNRQVPRRGHSRFVMGNPTPSASQAGFCAALRARGLYKLT
jgi:hypothetical protein